jgi:hypothetical protein
MAGGSPQSTGGLAMRAHQLGMEWLEPLLLQAFEEYRAQQVQIETMLEEGVVLAILFFNYTDAQREAALFQSCFVDDTESEKLSCRSARNLRPDEDLEN